MMLVPFITLLLTFKQFPAGQHRQDRDRHLARDDLLHIDLVGARAPCAWRSPLADRAAAGARHRRRIAARRAAGALAAVERDGAAVRRFRRLLGHPDAARPEAAAESTVAAAARHGRRRRVDRRRVGTGRRRRRLHLGAVHDRQQRGHPQRGRDLGRARLSDRAGRHHRLCDCRLVAARHAARNARLSVPAGVDRRSRWRA